ncbi:ROK family transcriptional regulator [Streptomyces sp. NP160]|uniref:ROK family transcriptional regulator n=1 Tax=Streptomyces sp. NP160 TaxID=2586637 RepID=UPI00214C481E|nr:ROK family transcriptional regulator [Streptomyces sp. NP160]
MTSATVGPMTSAWAPLEGPAHDVALAVLVDGPLARSEIARRLGLSPGTLTRLSRPLLDAGLLVETEGAHAPSGHPTRPLDVDEGAHHFVGVKLTEHTAHVAVTGLRAGVVASDETLLLSTDPAEVVETVARLVRSAVGAAGVAATVRAVGISVGGQVAQGGLVVDAQFLRWHEVALGPRLAEALGLPVVVDNDLLSLSRAEQWFGAARGCDHFAVITVGEGVGYAYAVHGQVVDAPDAGLGTVGHLPLDPNGPLCRLGHAGCADAMLSTAGITTRASIAHGRQLHRDEVYDLAESGDPVARRVVDDSARALGRMVALVGNLVMPEKVIISGEGVRLAEVGAQPLAEAVAAGRSPRAAPLPVEVQVTGFTEWARGAAVTAIRTFVLGEGR